MKKIINIILSAAIAASCVCTAAAADDTDGRVMLWSDEFNTAEDLDINKVSSYFPTDKSEMQIPANDKYMVDGTLKASQTDNVFANRQLKIKPDINLRGSKKISVETRFKYTTWGDDNPRLRGGLMEVRGNVNSDNADVKNTFAYISYSAAEGEGVKLGANYEGGTSYAGVDTGFNLDSDTWYVITGKFDLGGKGYTVEIKNDDGDVLYSGSEYDEAANVNFRFNRTPNEISEIYLTHWLNKPKIPGQSGGDKGIIRWYDYVRIWDDSFRVTDTSVKNGDTNVRTDTAISVSTPREVSEESSFDNISVKTENGSSAELVTELTDSGFDIYFPAGLKYGERYTLSIGDGIRDNNGEELSALEIEFETENKPFYITEPDISDGGGKIRAAVKSENYTADNIRAYLITAVYDENGTLVKMTSEEKDILSGTDETEIINETDVSEISNFTYKSYCFYLKI